MKLNLKISILSLYFGVIYAADTTTDNKATSDSDPAIGGRQTTFMAEYFPGESEMQTLMGKVFTKLDTNNDGQVEFSQISDQIGSTLDKFHLGDKKPQILSALDTLKSDIPNQNGTFTSAQFSSVILSAANTPIVVNANICTQVKKIMEPCSRGLFTFKKNMTATFDKSDLKSIVKLCKNGFSSTYGFKAETCIVGVSQDSTYKAGSSDSCINIKRCVENGLGRTAIQAQASDVAFVQKNLSVFNAVMWIGAFGVIVFGLLAFIPFPPTMILFGALSFFFFIVNIVGLVGVFVWNDRQKQLALPINNIVNDYINKNGNPQLTPYQGIGN